MKKLIIVTLAGVTLSTGAALAQAPQQPATSQSGAAQALKQLIAKVAPDMSRYLVCPMPGLLVALLADAFRLMAPGAPFIQFTYGLVSPVPREAGGFTAEVSPPVWLNLPPARVWCYRPALEQILSKRGNPNRFLGSIKERTGRVKDEILETCDRIETEIRLARDRMRMDIEGRAARVRSDRHVRPALELLRRIGEQRRMRR